MIEALQSFHFIRPWWLLSLLPAALLICLIWKHQDSTHSWRKIMDPHLLAVLMTGQNSQKPLRPLTLMAVVWMLSALALAGPSWSLEPSPFAQDQAALIIVLKVSESMEEQDVQPSRAERAVQKIHDLLELRSGARSGLIAYSGSAHLVMPLTKDTDIINTFAADLSAKVMPRQGNAAAEALTLAAQQLTHAKTSGSILFITDDLPESLILSAKGHARQVQVLGITGSDSMAALQSSAQKHGANFTPLTVDNSDINRVAKQLETSFSAMPDDNQDAPHWQDRGWWLTLVIAGLALWWFRPGWVIAWN